MTSHRYSLVQGQLLDIPCLTSSWFDVGYISYSIWTIHTGMLAHDTPHS